MRLSCLQPLICFALGVALLGTARAEGDPRIEIRGRLRLELEKIEPAGHKLVVTGQLLEEGLGEPVRDWTVALHVSRLHDIGAESFHYEYAIPTSAEGEFRFEVPRVGSARYRVQLSAPGSERYREPEPINRELDLARRNIELHLYVPSEQAASLPTLPVTIEAVALDTSAAGSNTREDPREPGLAVELEIDGQSVSTLHLADGHVSTSLVVPPARGAHGPRELVVHASYAGDKLRTPAEATARVRLVETGLLLLSAEPPRVAAGAEVALSGQLRFGDRRLGGLPVLVRRVPNEDEDAEAREGESMLVRTAPDGSFALTMRAPKKGPRASFEASFNAAEAKQRGLSAATSELVVVEVAEGLSLDGVSRRPAGTALLIAACLLLALALLRIFAALSARRARQVASGDAPTVPAPRRGVAQRILGTLRIAADRRVAGRVLDSDRGRPLAGVRVELRRGESVLEQVTDEDGRFSFGELEHGAIGLQLSRAGHLPATRRGELPHKGELAALSISLVPLRAELLRLYGEALAPFLPGRDKLGPRTPRELESLVRANPQARSIDRAALGALRGLVEDGAFGASGARPEGLDRARREIERMDPTSKAQPPSRQGTQ